MFWIRFFWPRRKECAKWCDYYDGVLCSKVVRILQDENGKGTISDETAERLELSIRSASSDVAEQTAKYMSMPLYD